MSDPKDKLTKLTHIKMSSAHSKTAAHVELQEPEEIKSTSDLQELSPSKSNISTNPPESEASSERLITTQPDKTIESAEKTPKSTNLPRFLTRLTSGEPVSDQTSNTVPDDRALAVIDKKTKGKGFNPNSFSSIFNRDHEEISGIQRVFKKSIAFLVVDLALFGILALVSIRLFETPIWFTLFTWVAYTTITSIFYIIVADRSYVWLGISGKILLLLLVHSFLGQGFDLITLGVTGLIGILIFSAYSELEKIQLGSRLFFVSHITGETNRILSTVISLVLSLGLFNSMVATGPANFVSDNFLEQDIIMENVLIGINREFSLNRIFVKGYRFYGEGNTRFTWRDFLTDNYRGGQAVLTDQEQSDIIIACEARTAADNSDCFQDVSQERDNRLLDWQREAYPQVDFEFDQIIGEPEFEIVVRQHYLYLINDLSQSDIDIPVLPARYIVPALFAVALLVILLLVKALINWVVFLCTWLVWRILRWIGFVRIEVEAVEAEIVSI